MTSQAKAFQWSMGIHGMLILTIVVLQSFTASQTKVTVIDFTLFGNNAPPAVEQTFASQAPAVKQQQKPAKEIQPQQVLKKELAAEVPEKEIVKEVAAEQARSLSEVSSTAEAIPSTLPQAVDGPGGASAEEKRGSIPSPLGSNGLGEPSPSGTPRDRTDRAGSTQGATGRSSNAGASPSPETSRATYLKEHFVYIRDRITGSISYPHMARKMGWCGQVKIAFVVCEDGGVNDVKVVESSGFGLLDRNAVDTVKNVAPFPIPPVRAEIRMAITYRLN